METKVGFRRYCRRWFVSYKNFQLVILTALAIRHGFIPYMGNISWDVRALPDMGRVVTGLRLVYSLSLPRTVSFPLSLC